MPNVSYGSRSISLEWRIHMSKWAQPPLRFKNSCGTEQVGHELNSNVKGTSHDFIFQISLFSTLSHIFAYLETPPMR